MFHGSFARKPFPTHPQNSTSQPKVAMNKPPSNHLRPLLVSVAAILSLNGPVTPAHAAGTPPASGLAVWLKADQGVTTPAGNVVTAWADQAGGNDHSGTALGDPELAQATFANCPHPVIRFSGNDGFDLLNDADLEAPDLSVYVVGSVNNTVASEIFVGHFKPTF